MGLALLGGVRVVEVAQGVSGPLAGKYYAALGADVLKVEPPAGDWARRAGPFPGDLPHPEKSGLFLYLNTGKKGVSLNLDTATGGRVFRRLVADADILIYGGPAGYLEARGLGYRELSALNPRLVTVSVTDFGEDGPYRDFKGGELIAQALGGVLYLSGDPDREPLKVGGNTIQYLAGYLAFTGGLIAYYHAAATGEGQLVEVSLLESAVFAHHYANLEWAFKGEIKRRRRDQSPTYRTGDGGYVTLSIIYRDVYWPTLMRLIGRPDLIDDPRFRDQASRRDHWAEIDAVLTEHFKTEKAEEFYHRAQAERVPVGYLCTPADLLESAQYRARGFFREVDHPVAGRLTYPGIPFKLDEADWDLGRAPLLGEHNEEVYCGRLGYSKADLTVLRDRNVI